MSAFKPGDTFAYSGLVRLAEGVVWGAASTLKNPKTGATVQNLNVTLVQASDFSTTKNWVLSLSATAAQTSSWNVDGLTYLEGDVKFFDTANPDPVQRTETFQIQLATKITA